jgi:hypothetical protein
MCPPLDMGRNYWTPRIGWRKSLQDTNLRFFKVKTQVSLNPSQMKGVIVGPIRARSMAGSADWVSVKLCDSRSWKMNSHEFTWSCFKCFESKKASRRRVFLTLPSRNNAEHPMAFVNVGHFSTSRFRGLPLEAIQMPMDHKAGRAWPGWPGQKDSALGFGFGWNWDVFRIDTVAGWWWLEPWNFEWLSRGVGIPPISNDTLQYD